MTFSKKALIGLVSSLAIGVNTGCMDTNENSFKPKYRLVATTQKADAGMVKTLIKACGGTSIHCSPMDKVTTTFEALLPDQSTVGKGFIEKQLGYYGIFALFTLNEPNFPTKRKCVSKSEGVSFPPDVDVSTKLKQRALDSDEKGRENDMQQRFYEEYGKSNLDFGLL